MKIADQGIILSARKYSEKSLLVKILSLDHGLISGFVKNAFGKKNQAIYQIANLVDFSWQSRTEEQLGLFRIELVKSFLADIIFDPIKLNAISGLIGIIESNILEKEPHQELFLKLKNLLLMLSSSNQNQNIFLANYIRLEIDLLRLLGYGLDLFSCAVSGQKLDLHFVSPKSGKAVSFDVGKKYGDKLLLLPSFLINDNFVEISNQDLLNGLKLSGFFIEKYIYHSSILKLPKARLNLFNLLN